MKKRNVLLSAILSLPLLVGMSSASFAQEATQEVTQKATQQVTQEASQEANAISSESVTAQNNVGRILIGQRILLNHYYGTYMTTTNPKIAKVYLSGGKWNLVGVSEGMTELKIYMDGVNGVTIPIQVSKPL